MTSGWIDSHVHVWSSDQWLYPRLAGSAAPLLPEFTPEDLLAIALAAGVRRLVLIQLSFYGGDNRYLVETLHRFPGVFSGVARLDPGESDPAREMRRLAGEGVRGFRLLPTECSDTSLASERMKAIWRTASENGLLVCPHINPDLIPAIDGMCARFPETGVVVEHMARIGADGEIRERDVRALCALAAHRRVFVKVSAFYALGRRQIPYLDLIPLIKEVYEAFGPRRLLWGSDSPGQTLNGHTYEASLELARDRLDFIPAAEREWLGGGTAERLFFPGAQSL